MLIDDLWTMDLGGSFIHMVLSISIWVRKFETCKRSRYLKLRCCKRAQKCDERIPKELNHQVQTQQQFNYSTQKCLER